MSARNSSLPSGLSRYLPILHWLPNYASRWLRSDLTAGLTAAAVVIPQAIAYASIAGLPVQVGLYTALLPMLVYVLLGSSRPLSVSTTSTISILTEVIWRLIREAEPRVLAVDCSAIPDFEYTALMMLTEFEQKLQEVGTTLWLVALNPEALKVIERSSLGATLGHERMFYNLEAVVKAYQKIKQ